MSLRILFLILSNSYPACLISKDQMVCNHQHLHLYQIFQLLLLNLLLVEFDFLKIILLQRIKKIAGTDIHKPNNLADEFDTLSLGTKNSKYPFLYLILNVD